MRRDVNMPVALAVYLPEQYPRLVATAEDREDLATRAENPR
jgi:hypothetical protein